MHMCGGVIIVMETGHDADKDGCGSFVSGVHVAAEVSVIVVLGSNLLRLSAVCDFHEHGKWRWCVNTSHLSKQDPQICFIIEYKCL